MNLKATFLILPLLSATFAHGEPALDDIHLSCEGSEKRYDGRIENFRGSGTIYFDVDSSGKLQVEVDLPGQTATYILNDQKRWRITPTEYRGSATNRGPTFANGNYIVTEVRAIFSRGDGSFEVTETLNFMRGEGQLRDFRTSVYTGTCRVAPKAKF